MKVSPKSSPAGPRFSAWLSRLWSTYQGTVIGVISVCTFALIWEWVGTRGSISQLFFSSPSAILKAAITMIGQPDIWNDLGVSGSEFAIGFTLAIFIGITFGMLLGWYPILNQIFAPFVITLNATPRVALMPLLLIWFGIGLWSKVAIVFLGAVFPLLLSTYTAVRMLDPTLLRCARSFGARDRDIFRTIALPGSVPYILTGLRLGVGRALVGIVVGELVGATAGVGFRIAIAGATFQTDKMFVGVLIITGFGVLITALIDRLERRVEMWRPSR
jgi:ABC-type nitrate/sulfonate/bicarbonate transport system permease component